MAMEDNSTSISSTRENNGDISGPDVEGRVEEDSFFDHRFRLIVLLL